MPRDSGHGRKDPFVLEALSAALAPPYEVFAEQTGLATIEIVGQRMPDLILLDNVLPDISGLTILRTLQRISPYLPVILITGDGSEDIAVEAFRAGVRDYLKKPIDLCDLLSRVEAVLAGRQGFDEPPVRAEDRVTPPRPSVGHTLREVSIKRAIAFIEVRLHTHLSLDQVAHEAGMSKFHFCRHFKVVTGLTFREFLARRRIARAVELFQNRNRSVTEVYLDVGFKDRSHFARVFRKLTGQPPSSFRIASGDPTWPMVQSGR